MWVKATAANVLSGLLLVGSLLNAAPLDLVITYEPMDVTVQAVDVTVEPIEVTVQPIDVIVQAMNVTVQPMNNITVYPISADDKDSDGIPDDSDNCPSIKNHDQKNNDNDGQGDVCDPDDDNDGLPDVWENKYGLNPFNANDARQDTDRDGLSNLDEYKYKTDPTNPDTDGDGRSDGDEVKEGTDPRVKDKPNNNVAAIIPIINFLLADDNNAVTLERIALSPANIELAIGEKIALERKVASFGSSKKLIDITEFGLQGLKATAIFSDGTTKDLPTDDLYQDIQITDNSIIEGKGITAQHTASGFARKMFVIHALKTGSSTLKVKFNGVTSNPVTFSIKTNDTTAPIIVIKGDNPTRIQQGGLYVDRGANASDTKDSSVAVKTTGNVDTTQLGSQTITYTAIDKAGNKTQASREVIVDTKPERFSFEDATLSQTTVDPSGSTALNITFRNNKGNFSRITYHSYVFQTLDQITLNQSITYGINDDQFSDNTYKQNNISITMPETAGQYYVGICITAIRETSGSQTVRLCSSPIKVSVNAPLLKSLVYGELTGRVGHQGIRPLQREPVAGNVYLMISTEGDVASLTAKITPNSSEEQRYITETPERTTENNLKEWVIKTEIPVGESSVLITMISSNNQPYPTPTQKIVTSSIGLKLSRSDVDFSPGPNTVSISITNHGEKAVFLVSATDNHQRVQAQFNPKTVTIEKDKSQVVDIPLNLLAENMQGDIYDYQIAVRVENTVSKAVNTARMDINLVKVPMIVSDKYKSVIINPNSCSSIAKSSQTVEVVIAGSEKLFLDKVDFNSIIWMNGRLKPLSSERIDKVSFKGHVCDNIKADGRVDLVMTFSLQDIINTSQNTGNATHWPAYIGFRNTSGFNGDVLRFEMSVGE
jgi:hypothetical protein